MTISWLAIFFHYLLHPSPEILVSIASFFLLSSLRSSLQSTALPRDWPLLGMLPASLVSSPLRKARFTFAFCKAGFTFAFEGPRLLYMDFLITCDPVNVNHIFNVNFLNYPKGHEFAEIFDILADSILNSDGDSWHSQKKMAQSIMSDGKFRSVGANSSVDKVKNGLIPFLDYIALNNDAVNL